MASRQDTVDFICDQMRGAGQIGARKMFGEYALYCGDKLVALVCDNQLFVKPTPGGRAILGQPVEAPPYPGAKPCFFVQEGLDDADLLSRLIARTAQELPAPKPKKPKAKAKVQK